MMKKRRKSIVLLATMEMFLISGCGAKEEVPETPSETFVNEVLSSVEEQTTATNETQSITSDEVQLETSVQSEEPAKTESASEPEPVSGQETQTTQMPPAKEVKYMDITHISKPYEQAVEISELTQNKGGKAVPCPYNIKTYLSYIPMVTLFYG
ncbi:MAG: hypothetical protein K2M91_02270 [Lachnospiraceae bacterium]|nr:hypothetical protein [Lachnospiraceae bacterium]